MTRTVRNRFTSSSSSKQLEPLLEVRNDAEHERLPGEPLEHRHDVVEQHVVRQVRELAVQRVARARHSARSRALPGTARRRRARRPSIARAPWSTARVSRAACAKRSEMSITRSPTTLASTSWPSRVSTCANSSANVGCGCTSVSPASKNTARVVTDDDDSRGERSRPVRPARGGAASRRSVRPDPADRSAHSSSTWRSSAGRLPSLSRTTSATRTFSSSGACEAIRAAGVLRIHPPALEPRELRLPRRPTRRPGPRTCPCGPSRGSAASRRPRRGRSRPGPRSPARCAGPPPDARSPRGRGARCGIGEHERGERAPVEVPSAPTICAPKRSTTASKPAVPGSTASRAKTSASRTTAPRSASMRATVDLPEPIPPVRPTSSTELLSALAPLEVLEDRLDRDAVLGRRGLGRLGRSRARARPPSVSASSAGAVRLLGLGRGGRSRGRPPQAGASASGSGATSAARRPPPARPARPRWPAPRGRG